MLERAELPVTLRLYDLRHSCATLLLAANENPRVVSERLGHASITFACNTRHAAKCFRQTASRCFSPKLAQNEVKRFGWRTIGTQNGQLGFWIETKHPVKM